MENLLKRITSDPAQCSGTPCIRGMRVRVIDILDMLVEGMTAQDIVAAYPYLEAEDVAAALLFAREELTHKEAA